MAFLERDEIFFFTKAYAQNVETSKDKDTDTGTARDQIHT